MTMPLPESSPILIAHGGLPAVVLSDPVHGLDDFYRCVVVVCVVVDF